MTVIHGDIRRIDGPLTMLPDAAQFGRCARRTAYNVAAVARRHGVAGGLLHYWRKRAKAQALETATTEGPRFIPVTMANASETAIDDAAVGKTARGSVLHGRMIAIEIAGARVHVPEGVDAKRLSVVLAALRRTS